MKLFLISQKENDGHDTYSRAVVCAEDERDAKSMLPDIDGEPLMRFKAHDLETNWAFTLDAVAVKLLGDAADGIPAGVVCASFNAS